ncbi:MAG TPA: hypothetical protein VGM92_06475 [Candidatus Kapabacteria bacterium]|jgi:hypothetical protein
MDYIEFDATLEKEGIIHVPEEYRRDVEVSKRVHVTLYPVNGKYLKKKDAIQELLDNPIYAPNFKPPTRDENYKR